jgi:TRAP-type C4-dicarboxylate transport system permease small subunit
MVKIAGYSHLWIALGAMCTAMATLHALIPVHDWSENQWGIATIIGVGTGALYTLQRRIKWLRMPHKIP